MLDTTDLIILILVILGTIAYFTKGKLWAKPVPQGFGYGSKGGFANGSAGRPKKTRNIVEMMERQGKNVVVFFGSQTGTAEDYSSRLAKEGHSRFGLSTMTADMEEFDAEYLDSIPADHLAIFVLATYGEGEPTDNAVDFYEFITSEDSSYSQGTEAADKPLSNLRYVAFGLGNKTYEHYNAMVRRVDAALEKLGARRIGEAGEGDDGEGTMEEDFISWKDGMWEALATEMSLEEREASYETQYQVVEQQHLTPEDSNVYVGEPHKNHLGDTAKGPYSSHNPFVASIATSRELFASSTRNCLHMEVSLEGSGLRYQTGDHLAVWPTNADCEVERLLTVLGLKEKRHTVLKVTSTDPTTKIPVPTPVTYDAILRYYLEICAPVSRQSLPTMAQFAPTEKAKEELLRLGNDKELFYERVSSKMLNIAQMLQSVTPGKEEWTAVPFSLILETFNHIQARYYSISSSSQVHPDAPHITAIVEARSFPSGAIEENAQVLYGVTTNYLLALKSRQHGEVHPHPHGISYAIEGPRNKYDGIHVPVHIRHSNFKLPTDPSKPIIMVGPGTGVAPFRGFMQERRKQFEELGPEKVGKSLLFFGCRKKEEDFLYRDEWAELGKIMGDKFEMVNAFSREQKEKVYVQHMLAKYSAEVNQLLEKGAYFYICGDAANMARAVNAQLGQVIEKERGLKEGGGDEIVKMMRASNLYLEDVWS